MAEQIRCLRQAWLLVLMLLAPAGLARQLEFHQEGSWLVYRWQQPDGRLRLLELRLPPSSVVPPLIPWSQKQADTHIYQALLADAQRRYPAARFRLLRDGHRWQLEYRASQPAQLAEIRRWLEQQQQRRLEAYLRQHHFILHPDADGERRVQIDYVRLIRELGPEMAELARHIVDLPRGVPAPRHDDDKRYSLALLLDFVQSIPYQSQASTASAPGLGFLLPQELLVRNAGDCDSKVVLLASLLRGLYPDLPLGLVLLPDHALLGVAMPAEAGEQTLRLSGHRLLLVEAAGPANLPPGVLGRESLRYLEAKRYTHLPVP